MAEDRADGWFVGIDPADTEAAAAAIDEGEADAPADWPARAVEAGAVADEAEYYGLLHDATLRAARTAADAEERAADRQLAHAVRALDDTARVVNELTERLAEWGGSYLEAEGTGVEYARAVADREPEDPTEARLVGLADRIVGLAAERTDLRAYIERTAPTVAPNLAALAGPVLAARLIALAGGLGALAKKPSGTLQVLGAEDALFAHLDGRAPSPKHGVIYTHEYVRNTRPEDRGSAARALAGKLTIAARIDHYAGDRRPGLEADLEARIERIRERGADG